MSEINFGQNNTFTNSQIGDNNKMGIHGANSNAGDAKNFLLNVLGSSVSTGLFMALEKLCRLMP